MPLNKKDFTTHLKHQEIIEAFNTPLQQKINAIKVDNTIYQTLINKNIRKIYNLSVILDKEQDQIANNLDRTHPDWRRVLIGELLKNNTKK